MLELLAHVDTGRALGQHVAFPVSFDPALALTLEWDSLPAGWDAPVPPIAVQAIGDEWIASGASVLLRVPSALLPKDVLEQEHNYLINPRHEQFAELDVGPPRKLIFDARLPR
jgi:RES domain-containing protein